MTFPRCTECHSGPIGCDCPVFIADIKRTVEEPKTLTMTEALEFALKHVRNYNDRCYLGFLLSMEKRKNETVSNL